jgi:NADH-quinone oxidoreductase subunit G
MPKIRIDEHEVEVGEGENLIDVATRIGVHIPHFCYHPGLSVAGNCRQCLVQIEGAPKMQIACNTPVKDGMVVITKSPEVAEARRGVLEFLLLNHPIDCPICDQAGECRLQEYYMSHGLYDARRNVDKVHKAKVVDLGPHVILDAERCVLCTRCVRFCEEVAGVDELYLTDRGHESEITTFPGRELENPYSGNVVDICPVGALLSKDFRFKSRVWWLKKANSVCSSCARGCNIRVDHHWNKVQRLVPRYNPEVNQWWMCDRGRTDFAWVNENRLTEAHIGGEETGLREALDAVRDALQKCGQDIAVLLSPKLANEDLLVLQRLFRDVHPVSALGAGSLEPLQEQDDVLRRADPHPNSWMVQALGLSCDVGAFLRESKAKALLVFGDDPVRWDAGLADALQSYEFVAAWMVNHNATAAAVSAAGGWLLPLATHFEYAGSFTNFSGRVQRFEPALALVDAALPGYEFGIELAHTLGTSLWPGERPDNVLEAIWHQIAAAHPDIPQVSWADVPQFGLFPHWTRTANPRSVMAPPDPMRSGFAGAVEVQDG